MLLALWSAYFQDAPPVEQQTTGGIDTHQAKKYREQLQRLEKLTRIKEITKADIIAAQIIEELPVIAPQIEAIAEQKIEIDYTALIAEITKVRDYLEMMMLKYIAYQDMKRKEEEFIILMTIN